MKQPGAEVAPLVKRFAKWFAGQPMDSLGLDRLEFAPIRASWNSTLVPRLRKDGGYVLFETGDGGMVVPLQLGDATPVLLLDSDRDVPTLVAPSIEAFFLAWSKGKTSLLELDGFDGEGGIAADGRRALTAWTASEGLKPRKQTFDLGKYLDGAPAKGALKPHVLPPAARTKGLPKRFDALVDLIGRRVDDQALVDFVTKELKQKVPQTLMFLKSGHASNSRLGVELVFEDGNTIRQKKLYPHLQATKNTSVPYFFAVHFDKAWPEKLPFGLTWDAQAEQVTRALGAPKNQRDPFWEKEIDPTRKIILHVVVHKSAGLRLLVRIR